MRRSLRVLLGEHPVTRALRLGLVTSRSVELEFADVAVPNRAFKRVVRGLEFDVAELALMTFLMARSRRVPLRLLPVVVFSRNPLPHLVCDRGRGARAPEDLPGRRVGVRSFTTTTAVWTRALLADRFGVDWRAIDWVTLDEAHVAGVADPPNARRDRSGHDLPELLRDGRLDAAIVDRAAPGSHYVPVVAEADAVYREWQRVHGALTVNHVVVVSDAVASDAALVRELFSLFAESRERAGSESDRDAAPIGLDDNRRNLEVAIRAAAAEELLARPLTIADLCGDVAAALTRVRTS